MKAQEIYKGVRITNFSHTGNKVTQRRIVAVLPDGTEGYNFTQSIAAAKIMIDAVLESGAEISDGRLVLTMGQLCELQVTADVPHRYLDRIAQIIKVGV